MHEAFATALSTILIVTFAAVLVGTALGLCGTAIVYRWVTWPYFEKRWIIPTLQGLYAQFSDTSAPEHVKAYLASARARGLIQ